MVDTDATSLRIWTLATFRATAFALIFIVYAHYTDTLKETLARLDTRSGVVAFAVLWGLTWYVTRVSVARMTGGIERASSSVIIWRATLAGALNGACVGALLLVPTFARVLFNRPDAGVPWAFFGLQLVAVAVSWLVGAIVGLLFGLVESVLLGVGSMISERILATRFRGTIPP